jgi:hypothetical protein
VEVGELALKPSFFDVRRTKGDDPAMGASFDEEAPAK